MNNKIKFFIKLYDTNFRNLDTIIEDKIIELHYFILRAFQETKKNCKSAIHF